MLNDEQTNLFYGLDVPAWIKEGLIDNLISYPWQDGEIDVPYFADLTVPTMRTTARIHRARVCPGIWRRPGLADRSQSDQQRGFSVD